MAKVHPAWRPTLKRFATCTEDLSFSRLNSEVLGPAQESASDLAMKLEQFLCDWLPESFYNRRDQLCGGGLECNNGFVMWRKLHVEHMGQGDVIEFAGTECLRTYGRCNKLSEVGHHIDGWYELFDRYGKELVDAHVTTRGMFLNILPKELKSEIMLEKDFHGKGHRALADWARSRALVLQNEQLVDVTRKVMSKEFAGVRISAITPQSDASNQPVPTDDEAEIDPRIAAYIAGQINAIQPPPKPHASARPDRRSDQDRGRGSSPGNRSTDRRAIRRPSPSPAKRLIGWDNRCYHCGSKDHTRKDCKSFIKMMDDHNKGTPADKRRPPPGYKSALAKARDKAREDEKKTKKIAALTEGEDTASEDDDSFSQVGGSFNIHAIRPLDFKVIHKGTPWSQAQRAKEPIGSIA